MFAALEANQRQKTGGLMLKIYNFCCEKSPSDQVMLVWTLLTGCSIGDTTSSVHFGETELTGLPRQPNLQVVIQVPFAGSLARRRGEFSSQ